MSIATAHSGGRLQFNSGTLQTGAEFPFLNHIKTAQAWERNGSVGGYPAPDTLDDNGYPFAFPTVGDAAGVYTVLFVPHASVRPGNYILKWTGEGTVAITAGGTLSGVDGRHAIDFSGESVFPPYLHSTRVTLFINGRGATDYIRDIVLVHEDDEADYDAGEVFGALFKQRLAEGGAGVWRDLGWGQKNGSMITDWASRKPVGYFSYEAYELRPEFYAGTATGSGGAYALSMSGFTYADKAILHWMPNHDSPVGAMTLSVNGVSKPIIYSTGDAITDGSTALPTTDRLRTVVYDAMLDSWLMPGTSGGHGLGNGIPPEVFVQLCAETGMHPWFVQPHLSADSDFMPSLAQMVKDYCATNGITWMVPRFEGPNECWNTYGGFDQTGYAINSARARWGASADRDDWYGRTMSLMGQAISAVYGGDHSKYWMIAGVQTVIDPGSFTTRFESPLHVADTSAAEAAKLWLTHLCPANYWNVSEAAEADEATTAAAWDAAATQEEKDAIIADYIATTRTDLEGRFTTYWQNWADYAATLGIGLTFYEGNYSPDTLFGEPRNSFRLASKWDPELVFSFLRSYDICTGMGGEFPSVLNFSGDGPFSIQSPSIYSTVDQPGWTAIKMFKAGQRRFKITG